MRDPGTPRRNPFFEHTFDESQDGGVAFVGSPDEKGEPHLHALGDIRDADSNGDGDSFGEWGDAWGDDWFETMNGSGEAPRSSDALGGIASLVAALAEAQPEAVEHLVTAAHEVVLAVKTVVDAAEQALAQQRTDLAEQRAGREGSRYGSDASNDDERDQRQESRLDDSEPAAGLPDEPFGADTSSRRHDLG